MTDLTPPQLHDAAPWSSITESMDCPRVQPGPSTCLGILEQFDRGDRDRVAVLFGSARLTVSDVTAMVGRCAGWLQSVGVGAGDRVLVALGNTPQFLVYSLAAWRVGAIVVPANPMYRSTELRAILGDCSPAVAVCTDANLPAIRGVLDELDTACTVVLDEDDALRDGLPGRWAGPDGHSPDRVVASPVVLGHPPVADPAPEALPSDTAVLCYTSGTTGPPKGAMVTHGALAFTARVYRDWLGLDAADVVLGAAPMAHITGIACNLITPLLVECPVILPGRFDPATALDLIEQHEATLLLGSATIFTALMLHAEDGSDRLRSIRRAYSGGAPVAPALVNRFRSRFGIEIRTCYGLTETCGPAHFAPPVGELPVDVETGALAVGLPIYDSEVAILDADGRPLPPGHAGEIVIRGPHVFAGYWNNPDETAHALRDGWLRSGDVGLMDESGWFYVVDRLKDQINASGYKVWPREVEDVLLAHPDVLEVAVVGVPDSYRGESVVACVSRTPGSLVTAEELRAHCRALLAAYKVPVRIDLVEELPKTFSGKIKRSTIRAQLAAPAAEFTLTVEDQAKDPQ